MAADFYSEMGMDPFYSSLNPQYVEGEVNKYDTLADFLKNKKSKKKNNKSKVIKYTDENTAQKNNNEEKKLTEISEIKNQTPNTNPEVQEKKALNIRIMQVLHGH